MPYFRLKQTLITLKPVEIMEQYDKFKSILTKHCGKNKELERVDEKSLSNRVRQQLMGKVKWGPLNNHETYILTTDGPMIVDRVYLLIQPCKKTYSCVTKSRKQFNITDQNVIEVKKIYLS